MIKGEVDRGGGGRHRRHGRGRGRRYKLFPKAIVECYTSAYGIKRTTKSALDDTRK